MSLSVVSALGRLGVDPWREAARLAGLSNATAADSLAALIARLPSETVQSLDVAGRAAQIVRLLPKHATVAVLPLGGGKRRPSNSVLAKLRKSNLSFTMICLVLAIAAFGTALAGQALFARDAAAPSFRTPLVSSATHAE